MCFVGKHGINEDIAVVNATVVVKYGGIQTLLLASDANDNIRQWATKLLDGACSNIEKKESMMTTNTKNADEIDHDAAD